MQSTNNAPVSLTGTPDTKQAAKFSMSPDSNNSAEPYWGRKPQQPNFPEQVSETKPMVSPSSTSTSTLPGGAARSNTQQRRSDSLQSKSNIKVERSGSNSTYQGDGASSMDYSSPEATRSLAQRHSSFSSVDTMNQQHMSPQQPQARGFAHPAIQTSIAPPNMNNLSLQSPYSASTPNSANSYPMSGQPNNANSQVMARPGSTHEQNTPFMPPQNFAPPNLSLPPPGFQTMVTHSTGPDGQIYTTSNPVTSAMTSMMRSTMGPTTAQGEAMMDVNMMDPIYSMPVFGGEGYSRSPFTMADDFAAWLFSEQQINNFSPAGRLGALGHTVDQSGMLHGQYYMGGDMNYFQGNAPQQHPMAVQSILDTTLPESVLSEEKRQDVLLFVETRFNETANAPVMKQKEALFEGDKEEPSHLLSLHMMQMYIQSFWLHFHGQLPILHKPTFAADKCPTILLVAIMTIGASCLDKSYGEQYTSTAANLSEFLAWHLRWEIFSDADFRPPAKLWVFQALLLLEIYEKMYSTRALHERAHIHHATTITLMRRGSSLLGRSALDSPPSVRDDRGGHGAAGSSHSSGSATPEEWWNHWITNESTRRAAFAAFVIDSTHATMFGHSAVMVAHEMRLPLPCDEALWGATSSAEVGRVEASLHANGIKQITFLDGLKKTLNGATVRTNSFGRTVLMAGLLSVSWHMNQRDLQVSSLGVSQALGGRDKWRGSLTRAFDLWKQDFDTSLAQNATNHQGSSSYDYATKMAQDENVFEARTVLHHLAHMAMHVDIVDCQIFAGAGRLLGRNILPQDYTSANRRMKDWAPTARARDATFYALKFLTQVLLPEVIEGPNPALSSDQMPYSARNDFLLNRPWVLYFAALIVWSYGYALEGPISPQEAQLITPEQKQRSMRDYLSRMGTIQNPDALIAMRGRNGCVGMLLVLQDMFQKTRWELLHEAVKLLKTCVDTLTGNH
jgi:Fungal specific transcription factor domain